MKTDSQSDVFWLVSQVSAHLKRPATIIGQDNSDIHICWTDDDGEYEVQVITSLDSKTCKLEILDLPEQETYHLIGFCHYHEIECSCH